MHRSRLIRFSTNEAKVRRPPVKKNNILNEDSCKALMLIIYFKTTYMLNVPVNVNFGEKLIGHKTSHNKSMRKCVRDVKTRLFKFTCSFT